MKIKFGVGMGRNERIDELAELSRIAEEGGFVHATFVDQQNLSRDVYSMMTIAALSTKRIQLGQGVTVPLTRHPSVTANATASVNELAGGRVFLGIGSGGNALRSMGMRARPVQLFKEVVEFLRKYMAGQEAEFQGARMHSEWIRQPVPIYMAADGPRALQLAGELADGVIFMGGPPEWVKWKIDLIHRGAEKAGRDPTKIDIWSRSMIVLAESKEAARREASGFVPFTVGHLETHQDYPEAVRIIDDLEERQMGITEEMRRYASIGDEYMHERIDTPRSRIATQRMIDNVDLVGDVDDVCEGILKLGEIGLKGVATATYPIIDKKGMLREIASKIIPRFKD